MASTCFNTDGTIASTIAVEGTEEIVQNLAENSSANLSSSPEIEFSVSPEIRSSALWSIPLHRLIDRIRIEFSFPHGLTSVQIIERGCQEVGITPTHLQKVDAVTVLRHLGILSLDL